MSWYKDAVIYQIYPRSYMDSNGDGIGDIQGIITKLPYIASLGVDAIWLSPIYQSPMKDFGYDISDYKAIDPIFGCMEDLDHLVSEAHKLGLKVMLDMVLNHTSDKHKWFIQSELGDSKYSGFYIWKDKRPNNWMACFGGRAWTYSKSRGQYYLHSFLKEQPDLNWHNEDCRKAIYEQVKYYLDKGVDGFRLDVINLVGKDPEFRSNPWMLGATPRPYDMQNHVYDRNTEYTHEYIREFRSVIDTYDDRALLGEISVQGKGQMEQSASYLGLNNDELHLSFEFSLVNQKLTARNIRNVQKRWYELCSLEKGKTPCWVLSNHDVPRAISRVNDSESHARLLCIWLLMQRGASVIYAGEEIGMRNKDFPRSQIQDPVGKKYWPFHKGRDGERRPMQWDSSANMGFSFAEPWLEPNYDAGWERITVESQESDPDSMLNLYRTILDLRHSRKELSECDPIIDGADDEVIAYAFSSKGKTSVIVLNMGDSTVEYDVRTLGVEYDGLRISAMSSLLLGAEYQDGKIKLSKVSGVVLTN